MRMHPSALDALSRPLYEHLIHRGVRDGDAVRIATAFTRAFGDGTATANLFLDAGWRGHEIVALINYDDDAWKKTPAALLDAERALVEHGIPEDRARAIVITRPKYGLESPAKLRASLELFKSFGLAPRDIEAVATKHLDSFYLSANALNAMRDRAEERAETETKRLGRLMEYLLNLRTVPPALKPVKPRKEKLSLAKPFYPVAKIPPKAPAAMPRLPKLKIMRKNVDLPPNTRSMNEVESHASDFNEKKLFTQLRNAYEYEPRKFELGLLLDAERAERLKTAPTSWTSFVEKNAWILACGRSIHELVKIMERWTSSRVVPFLLWRILRDEKLHPILHADLGILTSRWYLIRRWLDTDVDRDLELLLLPFENVPIEELRLRANLISSTRVSWNESSVQLLFEPSREVFHRRLERITRRQKPRRAAHFS